ncbi:MAG: MBL fold metallo-hydrolase [Desulfurococcales archaeon]|nr:MBL fold metallo-hydrolase [Desulfurococcales archaeon]
MLITVIGGGGSYPPPGYGGPSILVDTGREKMALDCGEDCLTGLLQAGYKPCDIEAVYITHIHLDHWSGLFPLSIARIAEGCPSMRISAEGEVLGDLEEAVAGILPRSIDVELLEPGRLSLEGLEIEAFKASHTVPAYGMTIKRGGEKLVSYTGDTRLDNRVVEAVRGTEILIGEATLPTRLASIARKEGHMTVKDFIEIVKRARPRYGIAVHLSPESLAELRNAMAIGEAPRGTLIGSRGLQLSL